MAEGCYTVSLFLCLSANSSGPRACCLERALFAFNLSSSSSFVVLCPLSLCLCRCLSIYLPDYLILKVAIPLLSKGVLKPLAELTGSPDDRQVESG